MSPPRRFPVPGLGVILAIACLLVPIVGVSWWLNQPKREPVPGAGPADIDVVCLGRVESERPIVSLEPALPGKVAEVFVSEGQRVQQNDKLLKLDDEALVLRVAEARQALVAATIDVEAARQEQQFQPQRKSLQQSAILAARNRLETARSLYRERQKAREFGTVSTAELNSADAEVQQLEYLLKVEEAQLEQLKVFDSTLKVRAAQSRQASAQISLDLANKAVRDCLVLAPSRGIVLRVQASVGESVAPGSPQPAIIFRPEGPLIVRAELEQEFLGRVKSGMKATIQDDVRVDSPTWTGTVLRIGGWVARKRTVLLEPGEINDVRTVECVIALDDKTEGLLIGQRMRVRIGQ